MKPILLNNNHHRFPITLMKGERQPEIKEPTKVYLCEDGNVVGECILTKVEEYRGFPGRAFVKDKLNMTTAGYHDFAGKGPVYGWYLEDHQPYDNPTPLKSWGINHTPKTWAYSDGVEPEQPAEPAENEPEDTEQVQEEYQPEYAPEQQEGYVEPVQDTYQQEGNGYQSGGGRNRKRGRR